MNTVNNGGPAFPAGLIDPSTPQDAVHPMYPGMTLRDYFAAKAMQGELAAQSEESGHYENFDALAVLAYRVADAMLKARDHDQR
jgi:hypothetical protein